MVTRAKRYEIQVPLQYRSVGDREWAGGVTANVSVSGVLFVGDLPLEPETPVELTLTLPVQLSGVAEGRLMCQGRIVRRAGAAADALDRRLAMASTIANYHLLSGKRLTGA